jgi:hypothetical protein
MGGRRQEDGVLGSPRTIFQNCSVEFRRGNGASGTGTSRKRHSGDQPSATSNTKQPLRWDGGAHFLGAAAVGGQHALAVGGRAAEGLDLDQLNREVQYSPKVWGEGHLIGGVEQSADRGREAGPPSRFRPLVAKVMHPGLSAKELPMRAVSPPCVGVHPAAPAYDRGHERAQTRCALAARPYPQLQVFRCISDDPPDTAAPDDVRRGGRLDAESDDDFEPAVVREPDE